MKSQGIASPPLCWESKAQGIDGSWGIVDPRPERHHCGQQLAQCCWRGQDR